MVERDIKVIGDIVSVVVVIKGGGSNFDDIITRARAGVSKVRSLQDLEEEYKKEEEEMKRKEEMKKRRLRYQRAMQEYETNKKREQAVMQSWMNENQSNQKWGEAYLRESKLWFYVDDDDKTEIIDLDKANAESTKINEDDDHLHVYTYMNKFKEIKNKAQKAKDLVMQRVLQTPGIDVRRGSTALR